MAMGETAKAVIAPVKSTERTALSRALFSGFIFVPSLVDCAGGLKYTNPRGRINGNG
jgi:hypothetical protein